LQSSRIDFFNLRLLHFCSFRFHNSVVWHHLLSNICFQTWPVAH